MSIQVGIGVSAKKDPLLAAQEATKQAMESLPHAKKISLAIVFTSVGLSHPTVLKSIRDLLGQPPLIGCSGFALISNKGIFNQGIAILIFELPQEIYFSAASAKEMGARTAVSVGEDLGEKLLYGMKDRRRDFGLIFSDGLRHDNSSLLYGLQERLGASFPIGGALAADDHSYKRTYLYLDGEIMSDAACGILWGGRLTSGMGIRHGWEPLGKPRYVTRASGNILYEIDGLPANKIYGDYLGLQDAELKNALNRISVLYPIGIYTAKEEEYLLRNILSINDDGALILQDNIPQGSLVRLMIGTKSSCLAATKEAIDDAKNILASREINFALVFESISRYILLSREANKEVQLIKDALGENVPFIGIYTYGELAPLKALAYQGKTYFHNQTFSILAVGS